MIKHDESKKISISIQIVVKLSILQLRHQVKQRGRIGIVVQHEWYEPMSNSTADKLATERARSFTFNWYSSPLNTNIKLFLLIHSKFKG